MQNKHFSFPVNPMVGSSLSNIVALWRKHRIGLVYYPKFVLTFIVAGIFEIFNLWERVLLRRRLKGYRMNEPPVFIIGFWRSGTTLLHNILCKDPNAGFTTTFQVVFPHSAITQAGWLKKLTNILLPPNRPFDNVSMDMDFPQEEEFGVAFMQPLSLYNLFLFPADFDRIFRDEFYTGSFKKDDLEKWKHNYRKLITKAMINTNGTRYISKNPCSLGRIELLRSMFPDGRFIFIYRNPYRVVESLYQFMLTIFPGTQLQKLPADFNREKIVRMYTEVMNQYFISKTVLPKNLLIEVKMEDFVKDKIGYLESIYKELNLSGFENARPHFEEYLIQNSTYSRDAYEIPAETYSLMNQYASDIIRRLGYAIEEKTEKLTVSSHSSTEN